MKRVVLDTSAYCYAMRGDPTIVAVLRRAEKILLPAIVIGELLAGFRIGTKEGKNREQLLTFLQTDRISVVDVTTETADFYAFVVNMLKTTGKPIPTNDIWIAACALEHGSRLLTLDKHFRNVDGLFILPE